MRTDALRDEFNRKIEEIRTDMLAQVRGDAKVTMRDQNTAIVISVILTVLASVVGLMFSFSSAPALPGRCGGCWTAPAR